MLVRSLGLAKVEKMSFQEPAVEGNGDGLDPIPPLLVLSCEFPRVDIQNTTAWAAYPTEMYFLMVLEARSPRSGSCRQGWFLRGPLSLACRCHLLPMSSRGLSLAVSMSQPLLIRTQVVLD